MSMEASVKKGARVVAALVGVAAAALLLRGEFAGTPRAQVPRVTGETKALALAKIAHHDLEARVIRTARAARRLPPRFAGRVVHQNFRGGITLPRGSVVRLTVSPLGELREGERAERR